MYLFAYGTLQRTGADPSSFFSRYYLGRVLHKVGPAMLVGVGRLVHMETINAIGEHITHPAVIVESGSAHRVKGTLFRVAMPSSHDCAPTKPGTPEAEVESILLAAKTEEELIPLLDYVEGVRHPEEPYHPENYFYRIEVPCETDSGPVTAFAYVLNLESRRLDSHGGPARVVHDVLSGDWLSYIQG